MSVEVEGDVIGENAGLTESMILEGKLGIGNMGTGDPQRRLHLRNGDAGTDPQWVNDDRVLIENSLTAILGFFTPNYKNGWIIFSDNERASGCMGYRHSDDQLEFYSRGTGGLALNMIIESEGEVVMPEVYDDVLSGGDDPEPLFIDKNGKLGWYDTSSIQYKENIRDVQDADISWIYELRPRIFDFKAPLEGTGQCGLIAEEVEKVQPKLVRYKREVTYAEGTTDPDLGDRGERVITTADQPEGVHYSKLIVPMLAEMQRLRAEIDVLKERVAELEASR